MTIVTAVATKTESRTIWTLTRPLAKLLIGAMVPVPAVVSVPKDTKARLPAIALRRSSLRPDCPVNISKHQSHCRKGNCNPPESHSHQGNSRKDHRDGRVAQCGPCAVLEKHLASASPDLLREMVASLANAMMSAQADQLCGAGMANAVTSG